MYVRKKEAIEHLAVTRARLKEWMDDGLIKFHTILRRHWFDMNDLNKFMETEEYQKILKPENNKVIRFEGRFNVTCDLMQKYPNGTHVMSELVVHVRAVDREEALALAQEIEYPHQLFIEPKRAKEVL
jgi:hypothetical protein